MDKKSTERIEGEIEGINFATEILKQLKDTIKRQWIALVIVLCLWAATIGGFIWYINQYDYVSYSQDGEGYNNINTDVQGDVNNNNGTETSDTQEEIGE